MKRNMRLLSIAISLCMALGLFALAPGAAYAEVDVTPPTIGEPVVTSTASSPYHAGDTIVMTVDIQDESGIDVSTLYTDIYNPKGYVEPVYGENVSGNSYRFTYVIPENPWPGVWSFFYVVCSDLSSNANQEGRYIYDVAQFTVENLEIGDVTPPTIGEPVVASSASSPYHAGDTIVMTVDIQDESGIDVSTLYTDIYNPKGYVEPVYGENVSGNSYRFTYVIPENPWPGVWSFFYVVCSDLSSNANQEGRYIYDVAQFTVENLEIGDVTPPTIGEPTVTSTASSPYHAGDTIVMTVDIQDESGIDVSTLYTDIYNPKGYVEPVYGENVSGNSYRFTYVIPENPWPGVWSFFYVVCSDLSSNANQEGRYIYDVAQFTVEATPTTDTTAPNISNISVTPTQNNPNDTVTVSATLTDNVAVHHAFFTLISPSNVEYTNNILSKVGETDTWSGGFALPSGAESGIWSVKISAYDAASNVSNQTLGNMFSVSVTFTSVTGVTLNTRSINLSVGANQTLTANISPDNATNQNVEWTSTKPNIAKVDQNGKVTAVSPGAAAITVKTVDGAFTDTCNVTVKPLAIGAAVISPIAGVTYDGKAQTPALTVKHGGTTLAAGKDFTIGWTSNVNAGTAKVTITGKGNYSGTKTATFIIARANIAKLSFADISDKEWTGKKLAPVPAVKHGDLKLKNGTHFTVTHGANKNIGKGTLTIKAKSANYTGSVTRTFKIVPKAVAVSKAAPGKKQITVTWKKTDDTQKITKYEVRYRVKGAAEWKTATASAGSASLTIKKLSKGKVYQVQLRSYKTVNGVKYQSPWSTTKTSGKVK